MGKLRLYQVDFEPTDNYNTIPEYINYSINIVNNHIIELANKVENYYNEVQLSLGDLNDRVDSLEIESSEHDSRIAVLENKVLQMESMLSNLINKVNNLLGEAEIVHSVEDNVLILPNELTPKEPE